MTEGHDEIRVSRRTVLRATGAVGIGGALATAGVGAQNEATYVLEQGGSCVPIEPLSGDAPVEEFYGYDLENTRYSAEGLTGLQREATSLVFLYRGPGGETSLVIAHGERKEEDVKGEGGSVSFDISGLPADGEFVVADDLYDGPHRVDEWERDGTEATIHWTWIGGRTDGAAFRPLGDDANVTIDPGFNEAAKLYERYYEGDVEQWLALSGSIDDLEAAELDMNAPVTIRQGSCE